MCGPFFVPSECLKAWADLKAVGHMRHGLAIRLGLCIALRLGGLLAGLEGYI